MRFSFKLQSLLNWKESLEEESRMKLTGQNRRLRKQEEKIQELTDQREENDRQLRKKMERGVFAQEYSTCKLFDEENYQVLLQMESNRKQMAQEIKEEWERLTGLMKERKILERLKEKRFRTYLNRQKKLEQKYLDEAAIGAYRRGLSFTGHSNRDS